MIKKPVNSKNMNKKLSLHKEDKMKKSRNRLQKMQNFQKQERSVERIEPISENHKYMLELIGRRSNEKIPTNARGPTQTQHP